MKKLSLLTILFVFFSAGLFAQKAFDDDTKLVSLGIGFGSPYWSPYLKSSLPDVGLTFKMH